MIDQILGESVGAGVKPQSRECKLCVKDVPYMGHLLTAEGLKMGFRKVEAVREMVTPNSEDVKPFTGIHHSKHVLRRSRNSSRNH